MKEGGQYNYGLHLQTALCISLNSLKTDIYGCILMISALLGLIGSVFQLLLWKSYLKGHTSRHKPSSNPHVVFNLALANALSCLASIVIGLVLLLIHSTSQNGLISSHVSSKDIHWFFTVEVLCDFGYAASSIWTLIYLLDVCFQVHKVNCKVVYYNLFAWGLAAFFTILIEVFKFSQKNYLRECTALENVSYIVIIWVSNTFLLMVVSSAVLISIDHKVKLDICFVSNAYTAIQRTLMQRVRAKFVFLLVIFFTCWVSTLIGGLLVLAKRGPSVQEALSFTEAILHPLQGIFNYFIFTPLRSLQNVSSYHGDRKSPILPHAINQQIYGTSYESSLTNSTPQVPNTPSISSFHFTPCFPDADLLFRSYRSTDTLDSVDNYSYENNLKIGCLLGENHNFYQ